MNFRSLAIYALSIVAAFAGYIGLVTYDLSSTAPGETGQKLDGFLQTHQSLRKINLMNASGSNVLFVAGSFTRLSWLTLPSGPPCHVFSEQGELLDWTSDEGDDSRFRRRWPYGKLADELSTEQALAIVKNNLQKGGVQR
jgi:hypothetical protein